MRHSLSCEYTARVRRQRVTSDDRCSASPRRARDGSAKRSLLRFPSCAAWLSILVLPACLDGPPTFGSGFRTPPFLVVSEAEPPVGAIYTGDIPFDVSVPFLSEDAGDDLVAFLFVDLRPGVEIDLDDLVDFDRLPASTYEDDTRRVQLTWGLSVEGCHSMTLMLTRELNWPRERPRPIDDSEVARLVWWMHIDPGSPTAQLDDCPSAGF